MFAAFAPMTTATAGSSEKPGARSWPGTSPKRGKTSSTSSSPVRLPVEASMPPMTSAFVTLETSGLAGVSPCAGAVCFAGSKTLMQTMGATP